jgi:hypothetical protein
MKMLLALALSFADAAPALAQEAPAPAATSAPATAQVADKKVCRREVPTGSNMVEKTCHLKSEWAAIDAQNSKNVEQARNGTYGRR